MNHNAEPARGAEVTSIAAEAAAPSCYRVSVISGSLEITARLKNADDLNLLVKVLEANKELFAKASPLVRPDRLENRFSKEYRSQTEQSPDTEVSGELIEGKMTKNGAKSNRSEAKQSVEGDSSEKILALT